MSKGVEMTMTENETKVPASTTVDMDEALTAAAESEVTIDLASIVNVEGIFGRALLDEVAAATAELTAMKGDLQPLMARLVATFKACEEATRRVYPVNGEVPGIVDSRLEVLDGLSVVLDAASGLTQLHDLACEVGIGESVA